ncbi:MAG: hypothetical protein LBK99_25970 [Opitutaceae bacterium]|jgi:hypothetical protein|nr:hypothetical protein [Opitutaceae bacterium]
MHFSCIHILLTSALAAGIPCVMAADANTRTLKQPGIVLDAGNWNDIRIQDENGKTLLTLTGIHLKWTPAARATSGTIRHLATEDNQPALEIGYDFAPGSGDASTGTSRIAAIARLVPRPGRVDIDYQLRNVPASAKPDGSMFTFRFAPGAVPLPSGKPGLWKRHEHGGIPQEHPDGKFTLHRTGDRTIAFAFATDSKANTGWRDHYSHHIGLVKSADDPGTYTGKLAILLTPPDWPAELASARWHDRPTALKLHTDKTFNWWESVRDAPADRQPELTLAATLANTSFAPGKFVIRHWIRDFAGNIVSQSGRDLDLAPGQLVDETIRFRPSDRSIDPSREIFFAEVSIADKATGKELAFARTNLALLPPHAFKGTSADSIFGIAAYWPFPDETSVQRLMERMGVRWYRNGNTHNYKNITAIRHSQIPAKTHEEDTAAGDKWIREQLQLCVDQANPAWEFGNEINYAVMSIGMGDTVKDQERANRIEKYLGWVRAIRRIQREMGPPAANVKLLSVGLAGMDVKFTDAIHDAGGWKLLDGLALHPGRGNFTPDYPVSEPWQTWKSGAYGTYWNYYGSVRTAANLVRKYGDTPQKPKELWLTEVYASAFPNSFWEDSLRHGAENAILSFGLAMSENVKALMWYQLFDTVWHDKLGVNPKDREYYFGLINRDLGFKPALLAYVTAAEELDQAKFVRWLRFDASSKTRGLLFDTPRGPLAILWDRTDGYILTEKTENFASPEPWIDQWRSRLPTTLPVASGHGNVTTINSIGQRRNMTPATTARGPEITLKLTGAPVIIYGLDPEKLR